MNHNNILDDGDDDDDDDDGGDDDGDDDGDDGDDGDDDDDDADSDDGSDNRPQVNLVLESQQHSSQFLSQSRDSCRDISAPKVASP